MADTIGLKRPPDKADPAAITWDMATVSARLRGGPYDNVTVDLDASDPNNPPDLYEVNIRGPHEVIAGRCEYRRAGREHDGQSNADVWVYEVADCSM